MSTAPSSAGSRPSRAAAPPGSGSARPARPRRPRIRLAIAAVLALSIVGTVAGCTPAADRTDTSPATGAFPVTIEQAQGAVTIPKQPERIVTLGWGSADAAIALGTIPVGTEKSSWGGDAEGQYPWIVEAVREAGGTLPAMVTMYPELDIKKIVSLKPDLILAPYSGLTDAQFSQLSQLAPTVSFPTSSWNTMWKEAIEISGTALGKREQADQLVSDIEQRFAKAAADHPQFAETTVAYLYSAQPGTLGVYQAGDSRVDYLRYLGFGEATAVAELPRDHGQNYSQIGMESANVLDDTNLIVAWFNDEANRKDVDVQPLYAQIPAIRAGAYVPMSDPTVAMARTLITPYTLDYALDDYVADLEKAVVAGVRD